MVVHIGLEKTGTTSIQRFLADNGAVLRAQGFAAPTALGAGNSVGLCLLAQERVPRFRTIWNMLGLADLDARDAFAARASARFEDEVRALPDSVHTVLLSNEHLHSNLIEPSEIERLRDVLAAFADEVAIVVYLRRQDRLATSLFSTRIKGGEPWDDAVLPPVGQDLPYYFDFRSILDSYARVFGEAAIRCRVFERPRLIGGDVVRDFCDAVGVVPSPAMCWPSPQNGSVSADALRALSLLNAYIPCFQQGHWNANRDFLIETLEEKFPSSPGLVRRADAQAFFATFADDNAAIAAHYRRGQPMPLFSDDFSDYPEDLPDPASPTELAAVFACLWNSQAEIRRGLVDELERQSRERHEQAA